MKSELMRCQIKYKAYQKEYREANKEKYLEYQKLYRDENKDLEFRKDYYHANKFN